MTISSRVFSLIISFTLPCILISCAGSSKTTETEGSRTDAAAQLEQTSLATERALETIRELEQFPLSAEAPKQREQLLAWVVTSPEVGDIEVVTSYLDNFEESPHPFAGALLMQYLFGMAKWKVTDGKNTTDNHAMVESGLRSVLAAYKSMTARDRNLHDPFLDDLDRIRQLGNLEEYIQEVDSGKR